MLGAPAGRLAAFHGRPPRPPASTPFRKAHGAAFATFVTTDSDSFRWEKGEEHQILYGISGNTRAFWRLDNARQVIGYDPDDDSETRFAELIAAHEAAAREKGNG